MAKVPDDDDFVVVAAVGAVSCTRKFRGVGGGGMQVSGADAIIGMTGIPYIGCAVSGTLATCCILGL